MAMEKVERTLKQRFSRQIVLVVYMRRGNKLGGRAKPFCLLGERLILEDQLRGMGRSRGSLLDDP